jgi:restriction system protein
VTYVPESIFDPREYVGMAFASLVFLTVGVCFGTVVYFAMRRLIRKVFLNAEFTGVQSYNDVIRIDPYRFEHFVAWVYEHHGYTKELVTPERGDGGIDVVLTKEGKRIWIQAKRYARERNCNVKEVRELFGAYADFADEGWLVTTSDFTDDAREYAKARPTMRLINGVEFLERLESLDDTSWYETFGLFDLGTRRIRPEDLVRK